MTDTNITHLIHAQTATAEAIGQEALRAGELELELGELHEIISNADGLSASAVSSFADRLRALLATAPTPGSALAMVADERNRQRAKYSDDHDDDHERGELAIRAAELVLADTDARLDADALADAGFDLDEWDLVAKTRDRKDSELRRLVIAGAMVLAEIERLQRQATHIAY